MRAAQTYARTHRRQEHTHFISAASQPLLIVHRVQRRDARINLQARHDDVVFPTLDPERTCTCVIGHLTCSVTSLARRGAECASTLLTHTVAVQRQPSITLPAVGLLI